MYYTVYRTQNIVNGRFYFGVHKTRNVDDGYLGSGKILKRAIEKYGKQAFSKEICFVYQNPADAFAKEAEVVDSHRSDPRCYNLRQGGSGGFDWINTNRMNMRNGIKGGALWKARINNDPALAAIVRQRLAESHAGSQKLAEHCRKIQFSGSQGGAAKRRKQFEQGRARELFQQGMIKAQIARTLKISKGIVTLWSRGWTSK
jgi:hypothetical protein